MLSHSNTPSFMITAMGVCCVSALLALMVNATPASTLLGVLSSLLISLPLLDRTRFLGCVAGASIAGVGGVHLFYDVLYRILPMVDVSHLVSAVLLYACGAACFSSALLPMHPKRYTQEGAVRIAPAPHYAKAALWIAIATALLFCWQLVATIFPLRSMLISALAAAIVTLYITRKHPDTLAQSALGLCSGSVTAALVPLTPLAACLVGALAAWAVIAAHAASLAIRLDDPFGNASMLLAAILSLLLPGVWNALFLAPALIWLAASLLMAGVMTFLVWPLVMLLVGFALPARRMREAM